MHFVVNAGLKEHHFLHRLHVLHNTVPGRQRHIIGVVRGGLGLEPIDLGLIILLKFQYVPATTGDSEASSGFVKVAQGIRALI